MRILSLPPELETGFSRRCVLAELCDLKLTKLSFTQHSPGKKVSDHTSSQHCTTKPDRQIVSLRGQL